MNYSFEEFLSYKYDNSMKAFLNDRKKLSQIQQQTLLTAGRLLPPKLHCLKQINIPELGDVNVIPVALRRGPVQRFKLPFKGLISQFPELEYEFSFLKTSASFGKRNQVVQTQNASPIEFQIQPNMIKVNYNVHSFVNVTAKFKNSYLLNET